MRDAFHRATSKPYTKMVSCATGLLLLALGLLACASAETEAPPLALPNTATSLPPSTPLPTQAAQIPEQRLLILEWPETIRVGDSDLILLTLEVDAEGNLTPTASIQGHQVKGEIFTVPNLYATHFVFAEGRLDISGLEVKPNPEIIESLQPGKRVKFAWSIRAEQVGNYRGMVWLHLVFKPKSGGIEERLALAAQRIDIRAVNLLGMSGNAARWMGVLGTLLGSLLSFDPIPALFGKLWKKKNECHPSRDQED